jgi:hypothetical protein
VKTKAAAAERRKRGMLQTPELGRLTGDCCGRDCSMGSAAATRFVAGTGPDKRRYFGSREADVGQRAVTKGIQLGKFRAF